jgi:hypothetical protein
MDLFWSSVYVCNKIVFSPEKVTKIAKNYGIFPALEIFRVGQDQIFGSWPKENNNSKGEGKQMRESF